jgi:hypothetical protein
VNVQTFDGAIFSAAAILRFSSHYSRFDGNKKEAGTVWHLINRNVDRSFSRNLLESPLRGNGAFREKGTYINRFKIFITPFRGVQKKKNTDVERTWHI